MRRQQVGIAFAGVEDAKVPLLPPGWSACKVVDVAQVSGGVTKNAAKTGEEYPYLRVANVYANELRLDDVTTIPVAPGELDRVLLRKGDLLIVEGNGSVEQIGRVALWDGSIDPCVHQNHLIKARCADSDLPSWLLYWLMSPEGRAAVVGVASSTSGLHTLSLSKVEALPARLAPRDARASIVEALDSYLTRLDAAAEGLKRVEANLKRYRASVLKAAVEGRLVPTEAEFAKSEGRSFEPASVLLERILCERRRRWEEAELAKLKAKGETTKNDKWKAKYEEPAAPDVSELPELPEGWCWVVICQVSEVSGGVTKNAGKEKSLRSVPYLRVANVYADELRLGDVGEIGVSDAELERVLLEPDDLLVVEGNGSLDQIGRVARWDGSISPCVHQNHLIKVRQLHHERGRLARWMVTWLLSPGGRSAITAVASSTSGLHTLSLSKVERVVVPLPPDGEIDRVLEAVDQVLSDVDAVSVATSANLRRIERLRQAILKWAFEGKLVDQDPNDEPASALLARIRAEREATTKTPKPTKTREKARKAT